MLASWNTPETMSDDPPSPAPNSAHVMLIVGYNDAYTTTTGAVRVQNSFGTGWGENGFVWIAYDALESTAQERGVYVPVSA